MRKFEIGGIFKGRKRALAVLLAAAALIWLFLALSPYPEFERLKNQERSIRFYDRSGKLLQVTSVEGGLRREWTNWNEIPKFVQKAFIQAEDRRFFFHPGADIFSAAAAAIQNAKSGRTVRGASTITMQVVKMASPGRRERLSQKAADVFNAFRIEARLSKRKILELYLNSVPFGQNCEGVASAARTFFGKELKDLSLEEAACLAIIPRRPEGYNPITAPEACGKRAAEVFSLDKEALFFAAKAAKKFDYPFEMPHYIEFIKRRMKSSGDKSFEKRLSASLEIQKACEGYIREAAKEARASRISNAALLLIDNKDNSVLAWIGNSDWFDFSNGGQLDGVLAKIQPGSSMKPFLYGLALECRDQNGSPLFSPASVLPDIPQEFGGQKIYIPENFNNRFNGPVRLRIALASSLNVPAVFILDKIGVEKYISKLEELGFGSLKKTGQSAGLGLALGGGEVRLLELVQAFSVWTRDGKDANGKAIYSADTARLICSILSDKDARALGFGYRQSFECDYPAIFKTGTSNQFQNITALGSTKKYTAGVWMGNFSGQTVIGKTGSSLPAKTVKNVLDLLEKRRGGLEAQNKFPQPENWRQEKICPLSGLLAGEACPSFVYEYVKKGEGHKVCDWHRLEDGERTVHYPSEFQRWLLSAKIDARLDHSQTPVTMSTPKEGAVFYLSPSGAQIQGVRCEAFGGEAEEAQIYYDGNFFASVQRPFSWTLPMEKGKRSCRIVCGSQSAEVTFEVK